MIPRSGDICQLGGGTRLHVVSQVFGGGLVRTKCGRSGVGKHPTDEAMEEAWECEGCGR